MADIRNDYMTLASTALALLREEAVAAAWDKPSALAEFDVAGLAGHLASQVFAVSRALGEPAPQDREVVPLQQHYARVTWIDSGLDSEVNTGIRRAGSELAAAGPADLADRVAEAVAALEASLPGQEAGRLIAHPAGWALSLEDFLTTRLIEISVHCDDLAVSVGLPTPPMPQSALDTVVDALTRVSMRRHGATAVLRALTRVERAPATIAAF